MIRILIADDHAVVREGIKQIIMDCPDMVVGGEATNGHEVLDEISKNKYDVVVLDISMPGASGLDILKQIHKDYANLPVLIFSMHPEEHYAIRALKAGASGYLSKERGPEELITALQKIVKGGKYISSILAEKLADHVKSNGLIEPHETLSDREYQIMHLLARGKRVKDIAKLLYLSPKTISTYRFRIFAKMDMNSNEELTRYMIDNDLFA